MLLSYASVVFYLVAAITVVVGMFKEQGPNRLLGNASAIIAILLHSLVLSGSVLIGPEQNLSLLNVAGLIGWLISVTMFVAAFRFSNAILLPVVYGFTALLLLASALLPSYHLVDVDVDLTLILHVTLSLFAYACLSISFLYAIQLAYINFRLKEKNASLLHSTMPPLMAVEHILFKLLMAGTALLSLSLLSGFMFLDDMLGKDNLHKTVLSLIAWLIYSVIVLGHARFGWRGKPIIALSILAGALLTLGYFGSRFVQEVLLN